MSKKQFSLRVEESLLKEVKFNAIQEGKSISDYIVECIAFKEVTQLYLVEKDWDSSLYKMLEDNTELEMEFHTKYGGVPF